VRERCARATARSRYLGGIGLRDHEELADTVSLCTLFGRHGCRVEELEGWNLVQHEQSMTASDSGGGPNV